MGDGQNSDRHHVRTIDQSKGKAVHGPASDGATKLGTKQRFLYDVLKRLLNRAEES